MPDSNGLPTGSDCAIKLTRLSPVGLTADLEAAIEDLLPAVIAEFQGPPGPGGEGGTGRLFVPVTETRLYDGTGYSELYIDDVVPNTSLVVEAFTAVLTNVILKRTDPNDGWNVLVRPPFAGTAGIYFGVGDFPIGKQNISVTTTFGFAATAPRDVYQAILNEVCYRALVECVSGIAGQGKKVKEMDEEVSYTNNPDIFRMSSSLPVLHTSYLTTKKKYKLRKTRQLKEMAGRMA